MLRDAERDGEEGVQQTESSPDERRGEQTEPEIAAVIDGQPADHGAERHDTLDAEVENARPLADQCAERAEDERRRDAEHGRPEAGGGEEVERGGQRRIR